MEWFENFKKLILKMHAVYDTQQKLFAHNVALLLENLKRGVKPIDAESALRHVFLMVQLGLSNSQRLPAGMAMGAFMERLLECEVVKQKIGDAQPISYGSLQAQTSNCGTCSAQAHLLWLRVENQSAEK